MSMDLLFDFLWFFVHLIFFLYVHYLFFWFCKLFYAFHVQFLLFMSYVVVYFVCVTKELGHFTIRHGWPSWLHCFNLLHYPVDQHDWKCFFVANLTNESTIFNPNILTTHEILESTYFSPLFFCMNFKYQVHWAYR